MDREAWRTAVHGVPKSRRRLSEWTELSLWCHPTISSSVVPFSSCPRSFPASGSFPVSQLFSSDYHGIGASGSASASVLPVNIQGWFPFILTSLLIPQHFLMPWNLLQNMPLEYFPGRPVVKTWHFHWLGPGSVLSQELRSHEHHGMTRKKKRKFWERRRTWLFISPPSLWNFIILFYYGRDT